MVHQGTWQFMAARLILLRKAGTPPPIPNREDDLESFWHVLLWVAFRHCDHQLDPIDLVEGLDSLFDHKFIGDNGQLRGGQLKRSFLTSPAYITDMELGSKILDKILVSTAELLGSRYSFDEALGMVQRMWEKLGEDNPTSDKELRMIELGSRIVHTWNTSLSTGYSSWINLCTIQNDAEWMEKIFESALNDLAADWDTGSANIQRILPYYLNN